VSLVGRTQRGPKTTYRGRRVVKNVGNDSVDDRATPRDFVVRLEQELGVSFTVDVAAARHNAKCARFYDRRANGLARSWAGELVFCNPPYSDIEPWVRKAIAEVCNGCKLVAMLLPANRTEQGWWQQWIEPYRDGRTHRDAIFTITTSFRQGRIKFLARGGRVIGAIGGRYGGTKNRNRGGSAQPPFGNVVVVFRPARRSRRAA
jgi:phage N-6-adenine-methyltransferase